MARSAVVQIIIKATNATKGVFTGLQTQLRTFGLKIKSAFSGIQGAIAGLGFAIGSGALVQYLAKANIQFQQLNARLQTFTGSAAAAKDTFDQLANFAATTPFELSDSVEAFITLRSAGIEPTTETLRRLGDQASAFGGNIRDMAEAVRAASTGEMERLKRFGVVARLEGDHIIANFQGQQEVIDRTATGITNYLETLSKAKFAGSMEREMATLGGAVSNLKDEFFQLATASGEAGLSGALAEAVRSTTSFINSLRENKDGVGYWTNLFVVAVKTILKEFGALVRIAWNLGKAAANALGQVVTVAYGSVLEIAHFVFSTINGGIDLLNKLPGVEIKVRAPDLGPALKANEERLRLLNVGFRDTADNFVDALGDVGVGVFELGDAAINGLDNISTATMDARAGMDEFGLAVDTTLRKVNAGLHALRLETIKTTDTASLQAAAKALQAVIDDGTRSTKERESATVTLATVQGLLEDALKRTDAAAKAANEALDNRIKLLAQAVGYGSTHAEALLALVNLEARLTRELAAGNLTLAARVALEERLAAVRAASGVSSDPTLAGEGPTGEGAKQGGYDPQTGKQDLRGVDPAGRDYLPGQELTPFLPDQTDLELIGEAYEGITGSADRAADATRVLMGEIEYMGTYLAASFASNWGDAWEAFGAGSISAGQAVVQSARGAVADSARMKARETLLDAGKALAEGLTNPAKLVEAAKLFAVGAGYSALAGALGGGGGGGGGSRGGGSASARSAARDADEYKKKQEARGTIIVQGGILDMTDPRQADALTDALATLHDERRVEITGTRG